MEEATKKKNRLAETFKALSQKIIGVFKDYPVTMIAIMLAALVGAIMVSWENRDTEIYLEKAIAFLLLTAMQTLAFEEICKEKKPVRLIGYVFSAILAFLYVYVLSNSRETLLGMDADIIKSIFTRTLYVHGVIAIGLAILHMFRRLEDNFEIYATKAFLELIKSTVVYGLFALGLALILWIFNELIFDTDDLLEQVEIFLAGGIYVPMCLKAISGKNEDPGKFARFCFLYVLQPMLLLAFAIIYVYIIKIFVTNDIPSNQIFFILAFLFTVGMPIWTMVHGMKQKEGILAKATLFLPYVFLPFVILQCWAIGLRIRNYGLTPDRYAALVLILCELIYFVLYLLHHLGNQKALSWIFYALIAVAFFACLCPGTACDSAVTASQMKRMTKMLEAETPDERGIKTAYRAISQSGYRGRRALKEKLSARQLEQIKAMDEYGSLRDTDVSLYASREFTNVDISAYHKLYQANSFRSTPENGMVTILVKFESGKEKTTLEMDAGGYLDWIMDTFHESYDSRFSLKDRYLFPVNEHQDFYATQVNILFNSENRKIQSFTMEGYLLEK